MCRINILIGMMMVLLVLKSKSQNDAFLEGSVGQYLLTKPKSLIFSPTGEQTIKGSPYTKDSFEVGHILTLKGIIKNIEMRFDAYNDWIEYRQQGQIYILDPTPKIVRIEWEDQKVINTLYQHEGKFKMGFFKVLDSARIMLFSKPTVRFIKGEAAKPYESEAKPSEFIAGKDLYYFKMERTEARPITSIKKMIESFPDHQEELLTYASKNKISVNQKELLQLWNYYKGL